jgi:hypothetical protein
MFSLGDASIAQTDDTGGIAKKTPPKRTATARVDRKAIPEPR